MIRFIATFALVWSGMFAWAWLDRSDWLWRSLIADQAALVLAKLVGVPLVAAWFTLDLLERGSPRRAFDPRVRTLTPHIAGLCAGLLSVLFAAAAFALPASGLVDVSGIDSDWIDLSVVGAASILGTVLAAVPLRRARRGCCVHCGYDLAGAPTVICPECGRAGAAA